MMRSLLFIFALAFSIPLNAQYKSEAASVEVKLMANEEMAVGNEAALVVSVVPENGWHVYSARESEDGAYPPTQLTLAEGCKGLEAGDQLLEKGELKSEYDELMGGTLLYYKEKVFFSRSIKVTGTDVIAIGTFDYMACNDFKCIPFTVDFETRAVAKQ